jgi:GT2 family glycosyltransferase
MQSIAKSVHAVVVSWNGARWIRGALESLQESNYPVRMVVVDNASTDGTVDIIAQSYPAVELLRMPDNLGFGRANNQGMSYVLSKGADYVLLLNQDAKVEPSMIGKLVDIMEKHPAFGIVSPLHLDYDGERIDSGFLSYMNNNVGLVSDAYFGRLKELYEIPFMPAAIWLLSRGLLQQVGGFDPLFFMYGEDYDLCNRARFHGFKIGLAPTVLGYHLHEVAYGEQATVGEKSQFYYSQLLHALKNPEGRFPQSEIWLTSSSRTPLLLLWLYLKQESTSFASGGTINNREIKVVHGFEHRPLYFLLEGLNE